MDSKRYIMLFGDTSNAVSELDDAAAGRLLKAILRYAAAHEEVSLAGEERFLYRILLAQFARDEEAYRKRSERSKRRRNVSSSDMEEQNGSLCATNDQNGAVLNVDLQYKDEDNDKDKDYDNDEDKDKEKEKDNDNDVVVGLSAPARLRGPVPVSRFTPPTPDEVRAYAQEAGLTLDPARFCDYNAARGWLVSGGPMSDWKAAARLWASRGDMSGTSPPQRVLSEQAYTQREYTNSLDALDRMMADWAAKSL